MALAIQRRRGTSAQHATFTGLQGEVTVDTSKKTLVVHDGATAGGFPLATEANLNAVADAALLNETAIDDHIADGTDAHDASAISVTPTGNIAATDVQAALAELDSEKASNTALTTVQNDVSSLNGDVTTLEGAVTALGNDKLDKSGGTITGNIDFSGANWSFSGVGARISGDFSHATHATRLQFQTTTVNGNTLVGSIPNGTSQVAGYNAYNSSDPNNASIASFQANNAEIRISAAVTGTGSYLPMVFYNGGVERVRITPNGDTRAYYTNNATLAAGNSVAFNPATHGQVFNLAVSGSGTLTFSAPTNITEGAFYTFMLKAGDTSSRTFAWNAAFKFPSAASPLTSGATTVGAYDLVTFIGGPSNTLIYNGHQADVR